jgi:hypothetical protein
MAASFKSFSPSVLISGASVSRDCLAWTTTVTSFASSAMSDRTAVNSTRV